jgi:hypothetical protein
MALIVHCVICEKELDKPGAILLSPPDCDDQCTKYHICKECFDNLSL